MTMIENKNYLRSSLDDFTLLMPYVEKCAEVIMEKCMVDYYKEIPKGEYLNQYLDECAIK